MKKVILSWYLKWFQDIESQFLWNLWWFHGKLWSFWWYFFFVTWFQAPKTAVFWPKFTISGVLVHNQCVCGTLIVTQWNHAYGEFRPKNSFFWSLKPSHKKKYHKNLEKLAWKTFGLKTRWQNQILKPLWFHENWPFSN